MVSDVLNYFPNLLRFHNSNELEVKLELQSRNANNHQETLLFLNRKRAPFALSQHLQVHKSGFIPSSHLHEYNFLSIQILIFSAERDRENSHLHHTFRIAPLPKYKANWNKTVYANTFIPGLILSIRPLNFASKSITLE